MLKKPQKPPPTTTHLGVRVEKSLKERIEALSKQTGLTLTEVVTQILDRGVCREEAALAARK